MDNNIFISNYVSAGLGFPDCPPSHRWVPSVRPAAPQVVQVNLFRIDLVLESVYAYLESVALPRRNPGPGRRPFPPRVAIGKAYSAPRTFVYCYHLFRAMQIGRPLLPGKRKGCMYCLTKNRNVAPPPGCCTNTSALRQCNLLPLFRSSDLAPKDNFFVLVLPSGRNRYGILDSAEIYIILYHLLSAMPIHRPLLPPDKK